MRLSPRRLPLKATDVIIHLPHMIRHITSRQLPTILSGRDTTLQMHPIRLKPYCVLAIQLSHLLVEARHIRLWRTLYEQRHWKTIFWSFPWHHNHTFISSISFIALFVNIQIDIHMIWNETVLSHQNNILIHSGLSVRSLEDRLHVADTPITPLHPATLSGWELLHCYIATLLQDEKTPIPHSRPPAITPHLTPPSTPQESPPIVEQSAYGGTA